MKRFFWTSSIEILNYITFYECGLADWLEATIDSDYEDLIDEESLTPVHWEHGTGWIQGD